MTKEGKIRFNYLKILAWLTASKICADCEDHDDEVKCEACRRWIGDHALGKEKK